MPGRSGRKIFAGRVVEKEILQAGLGQQKKKIAGRTGQGSKTFCRPGRRDRQKKVFAGRAAKILRRPGRARTARLTPLVGSTPKFIIENSKTELKKRNKLQIIFCLHKKAVEEDKMPTHVVVISNVFYLSALPKVPYFMRKNKNKKVKNIK